MFWPSYLLIVGTGARRTPFRLVILKVRVNSKHKRGTGEMAVHKAHAVQAERLEFGFQASIEIAHLQSLRGGGKKRGIYPLPQS